MSTALDSAWRAVQTSPGDVHRLEVLADLLLQEGDSFGELIRLELERERHGGEKLSPAIERHRAHIASTLRHDLGPGDWRQGFVWSSTGSGCRTLERCLEHPAFKTVRELEWTFSGEDTPGRIEYALTSLPPTVQGLRLTGDDLAEGSTQWPNEATGLTQLVTNLPFRLENARAEQLRSLFFHPEGLDPGDLIAGLGSAWFPRMTQLELSLDPTSERWPTSFLSGERCPALKRLSLSGALMPQHLEDLASSGLLRGLDELFLDVQHLDQFDEILSDTADRFDHLKRFRRPVPR